MPSCRSIYRTRCVCTYLVFVNILSRRCVPIDTHPRCLRTIVDEKQVEFERFDIIIEHAFLIKRVRARHRFECILSAPSLECSAVRSPGISSAVTMPSRRVDVRIRPIVVWRRASTVDSVYRFGASGFSISDPPYNWSTRIVVGRIPNSVVIAV